MFRPYSITFSLLLYFYHYLLLVYFQNRNTSSGCLNIRNRCLLVNILTATLELSVLQSTWRKNTEAIVKNSTHGRAPFLVRKWEAGPPHHYQKLVLVCHRSLQLYSWLYSENTRNCQVTSLCYVITIICDYIQSKLFYYVNKHFPRDSE